MSKWTYEYRQQMKEKVRSVLVRKPNASKYELAKVLGIDQKTALSLKKQVIAENTRRISDQKVNEEVGKMEAEYEHLALECWEVITQDIKKVKIKKVIDGKEQEVEVEVIIPIAEKLKAIKTVIDARMKLFSVKFDAGIFSRKLGELELTKTLTQEERDLIKEAIELDYGKPKPKPEPEPKPEVKPEPDSTAGGGNESKETTANPAENK